MGQDKALLRITPGGPTLLGHAIATAFRVSSDVFVVCPADRDYRQFGAPIVVDRFPGEGPLGGIVTALEASRSEYTLILSCDHPFHSVPLLRWMAELPSRQLVLPEVRAGEEKRICPIYARYRADTLPILASRFVRGERRLRDAIRALETLRISERDLCRFDPGLRSLINLNTPQDAERRSYQP